MCLSVSARLHCHIKISLEAWVSQLATEARIRRRSAKPFCDSATNGKQDTLLSFEPVRAIQAKQGSVYEVLEDVCTAV
jgi:hypothetical protein